jgi:thioester reductase-like protein
MFDLTNLTADEKVKMLAALDRANKASAYRSKYNQTEKAKAYRAAYNQSDKAKAYRTKYNADRWAMEKLAKQMAAKGLLG